MNPLSSQIAGYRTKWFQDSIPGVFLCVGLHRSCHTKARPIVLTSSSPPAAPPLKSVSMPTPSPATLEQRLLGEAAGKGEQASLSNLVLTSFCQERLGGVQSGMVVGIFLSWGKKSLVTAYRGPGSRGVASVSCRNPISIL